MDSSSIHLDLPEDEPTGRGWAALWAACTALTVAGLLSLFAWSQAAPDSPGFVSLIGGLIAVAYLATAYLLSNRLVVSRSPALILLAATYLLCGLAVGAYTVTYPGVAPMWFHRGAEAKEWFWIVWHAAAALGVIGFVAVDDEWTHRHDFDIAETPARDILARVSLGDAGAFMRGPLILAVIVMAGSVVWLWRDGGAFAAWFGGTVLPSPVVIGLLLLDIAAIALLAVALRRDNLVRTWLLLASVASLVDVIAMSWSTGAFTIGWYFSQACALIAASVLPIVLIGDLRTRLISSGRMGQLDPALVDPSTGFANERGLIVQLGRVSALALRNGTSLAIAVALVEDPSAAALVLRHLFRSSDVIGRTGEREFSVILTPGSDVDLRWLQRRLEEERRRGAVPAGLGLRIGVGTADPAGPRPVGDLLADGQRTARAAIELQTHEGDAAIQ
jgi:hypothetical protein